MSVGCYKHVCARNHYFTKCARYVHLIFSLSLILSAETVPSDESNSSISIDLLLTPAAPGFVLLGIEPAAVERPGTISDLLITILNRTEDLSVLPKDWSLEFAPYWLLGGKNIRYEDYAYSNDKKAIFLQTLAFSVATSSKTIVISDSFATSLALGGRFSILRGKIDPEFNNYAVNLESLYTALGKLNALVMHEWKPRIQQDPLIKALNSSFLEADSLTRLLIEAQIGQREAKIKQQIEEEIGVQLAAQVLEDIKEIISQLRLRRIGWKLDIAGGTVVSFPQRMFDDASMSRWGTWLTSGYEWPKLSLLSVVRYLDNYSKPNESSVDIGGRIIVDNVEKITLSAEAVHRRFLKDSNNSQWRCAFILDYAFINNKVISFTFGRNFDDSRSGDLITSINLQLGFGSNRPIL